MWKATTIRKQSKDNGMGKRKHSTGQGTKIQEGKVAKEGTTNRKQSTANREQSRGNVMEGTKIQQRIFCVGMERNLRKGEGEGAK